MTDYRDIPDADLAEAVAGLDYNIRIFESRPVDAGTARRLLAMKHRLMNLRHELDRRRMPATAER